jgi:hypothetical protein
VNPIYWIWTAIAAELGLLLSPWILSNALLIFWLVLLTHTAVSLMAAVAIYFLLPSRFHQPRLPVTLLLFAFSFVAPVIGALSLMVITRVNLRNPSPDIGFAAPVSLDLPLYDVQSEEQRRGIQSAIRSRLGKDVPVGVRMQSLLTLQAIPDNVSNPILEDLLGDDTEDVRLIAFGMLDAAEKKITQQIQHEAQRLTQHRSASHRYGCLQRLAELNWELVYACLIQGELRQHILHQASDHVDAALKLDVLPNAGLMFLQARILLALGNDESAKQALARAVDLGQPRVSVLPYFAEIAYKRRDFQEVTQLMQQLSLLKLASRTRAVEDFWCKRDNEIDYRDRKYLPHI